MDLKILVKQAKQQNQDALIELIMAQKDDYYRLAYVYVKNESDVLDAMQDMIVTCFEKIDQLKDPNKFYSWSKTILVNECKNILRKKKKVVPMEKLKQEPKADRTSRHDDLLAIEQEIHHLNEKQQEAIKLRYVLDLDIKTIAALTETSEGTVKSRLSNGIKKLREKLGGVGHEEA
ncbi:sigma-70 family RNA polymerase sigma factor [Alkalibacillus haloalkaliphilus]|uniref:RNA polymerase subunit sigma-24 n=1 Tax=Alkalibacillus haloalkaliphilus TaxID=94136 RepID=A0A511W5N6_9BACI|nr:sigma-70 family RNA polymerase sigma factor [Alkalibacillus haloalkaliphilus]GEN45608.1 hypothetical protein AHA02nite_13840 [Alkalibacillus haloalkaliphilus]